MVGTGLFDHSRELSPGACRRYPAGTRRAEISPVATAWRSPITESTFDWATKTVLLTGGTGSFGKAFTLYALRHLRPRKLAILSRDELKQFHMRQDYPVEEYPTLRFLLGDVRDRDRLYRALDGVDVVVHAAALKQVPTAEYNPLEPIKTNILGAANVIDAAIDRGVDRVMALSTDKAANPINLYGATKLCSDKLFIAANAYSGRHETRFSVVRYGNVAGSRGSVIPYFLAQRSTGKLTITDPRMTRFLITLDHAVRFVVRCIETMIGGEIFVPKIPSVRVVDLARVIAPDSEQQIIGIRPGEKLHEVMVPEDEAHMTVEFDDHYVIQPSHSFWRHRDYLASGTGRACPDGFRYGSDSNPWKLSNSDLAALVEEVVSHPSEEFDVSPREPKFIVGG